MPRMAGLKGEAGDTPAGASPALSRNCKKVVVNGNYHLLLTNEPGRPPRPASFTFAGKEEERWTRKRKQDERSAPRLSEVGGFFFATNDTNFHEFAALSCHSPVPAS